MTAVVTPATRVPRDGSLFDHSYSRWFGVREDSPWLFDPRAAPIFRAAVHFSGVSEGVFKIASRPKMAGR